MRWTAIRAGSCSTAATASGDGGGNGAASRQDTRWPSSSSWRWPNPTRWIAFKVDNRSAAATASGDGGGVDVAKDGHWTSSSFFVDVTEGAE